MKFFVTGASGFIGSRFGELALAAGHEVTGLVRPQSAGKVPAGVKRSYGTLPYDVDQSAVAACDVIIHLAAITTSQRAAESDAVNALGTSYLVQLAEQNGQSFLFVSTQSVLSSNASSYAVTKRMSEDQLRASNLSWAIVRPGLVYGPGASGLYGRMRDTILKYPAIPLLGGGRALVQPIHVDDLCAALLGIAEDFEAHQGTEFNLGDPDGVTMKEFLSLMAKAQHKKARLATVPLGPIKLVVGVGEKMRLPLPVSMDNLRGLETVQRMETAPSLQRLNLKLRSLEAGLAESELPVTLQRNDRIPIVLIGAGKIGIVHGLQVMYNPAARLAGIVEPSEKAAKLYKSMGFDAPFYKTLDEALSSLDPPKAAIIATPADTHLPIAALCLDAGLHVLVEKPLSVAADQTVEWRQLKDKHPDQVVHAGYMASQFPHLLSAFRIASVNKLGHVYRAKAVALQTHITAPEPVRWEMVKGRAGGGAMINFGCHAASILFRLLGWPDSEVTGWHWPIHSKEVEDSLVAKFTIKATQCQLLVSWSARGYARPYSLVELECEHGTLRVENASTYVIQDGEVTLLETQLDHDLSFNMSPDYTGGGFTLEHEAFTGSIKAVQAGKSAAGFKPDFMPPVEMAEALRLETWIRELYDTLPFEKPGAETADFFGVDAAYFDALGISQ